MKEVIFTGIATALYTPITNGEIDYEEFERLIEFQLRSDISALVFLGTTGEAATISDEERKSIIGFAVKRVKGRVPVIIGCGSNSTKRAAELTLQAKSLGADCSLSVTPYYNKCSQDGLIAHYFEIEKQSAFPQIVYNVPSRTGVDVSPETYGRLSELYSVVGIKEANKSPEKLVGTFSALNDNIPVYSGADEANRTFYSIGAKGAISVLSNIIPSIISDEYYNFKFFSDKNAKADNIVISKISKLVFSEVNPIPLKGLIKKIRKRGYELRLPLTEQNEKTQEYIYSEFNRILKDYNLKAEV
ncbi:MAG: 4-hydroxy-tetrahydrodipicolinate synthase [Clostridia bacterium]|nr:4-hydroxy-tetrahydrodipicolinate synthase [Clostridia bacterium]